ncbi:MAG TPA: hypothetical protein VIK04_00205 [Solirubrobacteraceae bacterium]
MTATHRRLAGVAASAGVLLASAGAMAAQAAAATITVDKPCYVNTAAGPAQMVITGGGFNPGDNVSIIGGTTDTSAMADPNGNFVTTATAAPELNTEGPGTIATTLTATDQDLTTDATITAQTTARSANLAVATKPTSIPAKDIKQRKITFSFSGFTPGKDVYGYYLRKRVVAREKFGKATGSCGTLKRKALLFPGGHPRKSTYNVAFESTSKYTKKAYPSVIGKLSILSF